MIAIYKSPCEMCRTCKKLFRVVRGVFVQHDGLCVGCHLHREFLRDQHRWRQKHVDIDAINAERAQLNRERIELRDVGY